MAKPSNIRSLCPVSECRAVIEAADAGARPTTPAASVEFCNRLLCAYPQIGPSTAGAYVTAVAATLARFSLGVVEHVTSLDRGIATTSVHLPSIAEIVTACEAEAKRIRELRGAAQWMIDERERREDARREELMRPTEAERQAMLEKINDMIKGMLKHQGASQQ